MKLLPAQRLMLSALCVGWSTFDELSHVMKCFAVACSMSQADSGLHRGYFRDLLAELVNAGLVVQAPGTEPRYALSPEGRRELHAHKLTLALMEDRAEHPERVVAFTALAVLAGLVLWALWSFVL